MSFGSHLQSYSIVHAHEEHLLRPTKEIQSTAPTSFSTSSITNVRQGRSLPPLSIYRGSLRALEHYGMSTWIDSSLHFPSDSGKEIYILTISMPPQEDIIPPSTWASRPDTRPKLAGATLAASFSSRVREPTLALLWSK